MSKIEYCPYKDFKHLCSEDCGSYNLCHGIRFNHGPKISTRKIQEKDPLSD